MWDVATIAELHRTMVAKWHSAEVHNPYSGWRAIVCAQHQYNFLVWHEEDLARDPHSTDAQVALAKRTIDRFNQLRNDWLEQIDIALLDCLTQHQVEPAPEARLPTETPGLAIDRLSVLSLRIYHMQEQADRADLPDFQRAQAREKTRLLAEQHADLCTSLSDLLLDLRQGRVRLKPFKQFKMYNDPRLIAYLAAKRKDQAST